VAKNNRKLRMVNYPEEREGRIKDANRKLRSDLKREKNKVKQLKQDLASLQRAFNKSCQYINEKLADQNIENIIELVNNFDYKETEKGREQVEIKQKTDTNLISTKCLDCGRVEGEGYMVLNYVNFNVHTCKCGFRQRVSQGDEGNEGS
jgi:hypothetical protein